MTNFIIDIETSCAQGCDNKCEHALDPWRAQIDLIGVVSEDETFSTTFTKPADLDQFLNTLNGQYTVAGHNLKFDLKMLWAHGVSIPVERWADDSMLMAYVLPEKIPTEYLEAYETRRKEINATLPHGVMHREAGQYSLKTLAPWHLGVDAFWETPDNHNNVEYVLKDSLYTARLIKHLRGLLKEAGCYEFYKEKQLEWTKQLLLAEYTGVRMDWEALDVAEKAAQTRATEILKEIDELWKPHHRDKYYADYNELKDRYEGMAAKARAKKSEPTKEQLDKIEARYAALFERAAEKLPTKINIDSPAQLAWLLTDKLGLDIKGYDGNPSTDKEVLTKLAEQNEGVKLLLEYRKQHKLCTTYFPNYREMQVAGRIHCDFNPTGTRTGRLSSSNPNLQNVARDIKKLFVADEGYKLITKDISALEPTLIAYYTNDLALIKLVQNGISFHSYNAKAMFDLDDARLDTEVDEVKDKYPKLRDAAKEFGLSVLYGAGANRVKRSLEKRGLFQFSLEDCRDMVNRLRDTYSKVWLKKEELDASLEKGVTVNNLLGRPIRFDNPEDVYMKGFNRLIQGSGSDIVQDSMLKANTLFKQLNLNALCVLTVHDEIVVLAHDKDVEEAEGILEASMTGFNLTTDYGPVKLAVEGKTGREWAK